MHKKQLTILLILSCTCALIQAQANIFQAPQRRSARYCGKMLADMLSTICNGSYNTKFHKKSSSYDHSDDYNFGDQEYVEEPRAKFPFRTRTNAAAFIPGSFRRYTRGVFDECCKKPCHLSELYTYCARDR